MQQRHLDRWQYFNELANTSRKYYIDYLKSFLPITSDTKVLEIGCGEGGNLLPFAELEILNLIFQDEVLQIYRK